MPIAAKCNMKDTRCQNFPKEGKINSEKLVEKLAWIYNELNLGNTRNRIPGFLVK